MSGPKIGLLSAVTFLILSGLLTKGRQPIHKWLMVTGYAALLALYVERIIHHGFLKISEHNRQVLPFILAHVHMIAGAVFLLAGGFQIVRMFRLHFNSQRLTWSAIDFHKFVGRILLVMAFTTGVSGLLL